MVLAGDLHRVDGLGGFNEQAGLIDLELGVFHLQRERAALAAKLLDEREDFLLNMRERLSGGKLGPVGPAQFLVGEKRVGLLAAKPTSALGVLFAFVEPLGKEKERELCNWVAGVGKAAGTELVPRGVGL